MTWDIDVGFRTRPQDLEGFLVKQGYARTEDSPGQENFAVNYEHRGDGWPKLIYTPDIDYIEWQAIAGHRIVAHLNINFHLDRDHEARRLATAILANFNASAIDLTDDDEQSNVYHKGESLLE